MSGRCEACDRHVHVCWADRVSKAPVFYTCAGCGAADALVVAEHEADTFDVSQTPCPACSHLLAA